MSQILQRRASVLFKSFINTVQLKRNGGGWKRRVMEREAKKDIVFQYAGKKVRRSDRIYVWGCSATGALGVRTLLEPQKHQKLRVKQLTPQRMDFMPANKLKVHDVSCGYGFSVFLCSSENGRMVAYGSGINTDSQLGYQQYPPKSGKILDYVIEPVPIDLPLLHPHKTRLTHIACGRAHTVIVTDSEGVFTLGNNAYGQCGRKVVDNELHQGSQVINKIKFKENIKQVVCGQDHTLFLTHSGRVYSCGLSADGQTGVGHYDCVSRLTLVDGDIKNENIVFISSRADTALAVSEKGELFGWGNTEYNQLGGGHHSSEMQVNVSRHIPFTNVGKIVKVAAAGSSCAAINEHSQLFTWGFGILGKGPKLSSSFTPEQIPETLFGANELRQNVELVDIQCGLHHYAVLTDSGDLYVWGKNRSACLGLGHILDQFFPYKVQVPAEVTKIACGVDHMIVLSKSFA